MWTQAAGRLLPGWQCRSQEKTILLHSQIPAFTPLSPTWSNHDFVFLGADPQECEVILGIDVPHGAPGLHDEAVHEASVLNGGGVVYGALDGNTCRTGTARLSDKPPEPTSHWASPDPTSVVAAPGVRSVLFEGKRKAWRKTRYKKAEMWGHKCRWELFTSSSISVLLLHFES